MPGTALATPSDRPRSVLFLAYPQMGLLDLAGAQTVFWAADKALRERGMQGYERPVASISGRLIPTAEGVFVASLPLSTFADEPIDTIIVPGSAQILQALDINAELVDWLACIAPRARRTASVCTGAFLLAEAGLLEGRRAATHWGMCDSFIARFPAVHMDRDAIFVEQDPIWTSAGVTAGIDMALALVQADCGREIAMQVARELVVFMKRAGGQSQFSQMLLSQMHDGDAFADFHLWLVENLFREDLDVDAMARHANMSARNFSRVYKQKTGRPPAKALELFRLEAARRLLEDSDRNISQISAVCGFGDEERMRVTFQRHLAVSPRDYRSRFSR
jgi:transcriptional regulator GlxA family with amidase domain